MTEITEHGEFTYQQEKKTYGRRLKNLGRKVMHLVRRTEKREEPQQAFSPTGIVESERKINLPRADKMEAKGCAVRAIMSAVAFATGTTNISATPAEWDFRFQQVENPLPPDMNHYQALLNLYKEDYPKNPTVLGKALKQVNVDLQEGQTVDQIKERIRGGEQIMIITVNQTEKTSHIFHAGLDHRDRFIDFSDKKIKRPGHKKRKYQRVKLFDNERYSIFSVTPKLPTQSQQALAT